MTNSLLADAMAEYAIWFMLL